MNSLINYIIIALKPKTNDEIFFETENDKYINHFSDMVQDALFVTTTKPVINEYRIYPDNKLLKLYDKESIKIGKYYLNRKCGGKGHIIIPREIAWLNPVNNTFEWDNTQEPLYRRMIPPPIETLDHSRIIENVLLEYKSEVGELNYVEYGVRTGENLLRQAKYCKMAYGVDLTPIDLLTTNIKLYSCYTDEFSTNILPYIKYNISFIDADHSSVSAFKDFQSIFKYIDVGGYIFLHDTYPCEEQFLDKGACHDCYKTPILIKENYSLDELEILTIPIHPGLTIVRKLK
jgi:hypothetical protein